MIVAESHARRLTAFEIAADDVTVVEPPELTNHDLDDFLPAERH